MKKKIVIKSSSMPARSPVGFAIVFWLLLDRLDAPSWAYGVLWSFVAMMAIVFIAGFWTEIERDVPGFGEN